MPVEAIQCKSCGSSDVTEFKPGSYVCGHCEAVFKHIRPAGSGSAVGCEIDDCGVTSVGRCSTCGRAFCRSHQARVDFCSACQAEKLGRKQHLDLEVREAAARGWPAEREAIARVPDRVERYLRAIALIRHTALRNYYGSDWKDLFKSVEYHFPGLAVEDHELATWFVERAPDNPSPFYSLEGSWPLTRCTCIVVRGEKTLGRGRKGSDLSGADVKFGGYKEVRDPPVPAWRVVGEELDKEASRVKTARYLLGNGRVYRDRDGYGRSRYVAKEVIKSGAPIELVGVGSGAAGLPLDHRLRLADYMQLGSLSHEYEEWLALSHKAWERERQEQGEPFPVATD